jgi:prolyl 4-hydroxylase
MKPHYNNEKKNFISGWYIDKKLCESIVQSCSGIKKLKLKGDKKTSVRGYLYASLKNLSNELQTQYDLELNKVINLYMEEYPFLKNIEKVEIEKTKDYSVTVQVQLYDPTYSYSVLHCENDGSLILRNRCLVFMTYLNSIEDEGGTYFPYQGITTKAEQGLTLVWPAYWTHPHKGVASQTEKKIIATGWYTFRNQ